MELSSPTCEYDVSFFANSLRGGDVALVSTWKPTRTTGRTTDHIRFPTMKRNRHDEPVFHYLHDVPTEILSQHIFPFVGDGDYAYMSLTSKKSEAGLSSAFSRARDVPLQGNRVHQQAPLCPRINVLFPRMGPREIKECALRPRGMAIWKCSALRIPRRKWDWGFETYYQVIKNRKLDILEFF